MSEPTGESADQEASARDGGTENGALGEFLNNESNSGASQKENHSQPPNRIENRKFWVEIVTLFAALWAAYEATVLAGYTNQALRDGRDAARESQLANIRAENLTADAVGQATASAQAANRSAEIAKEASGYSRTSANAAQGQLQEMRVSERAIVGPETASLTAPLTAKSILNVIYQNSGAQPATAFNRTFKMQIKDKAELTEEAFPRIAKQLTSNACRDVATQNQGLVIYPKMPEGYYFGTHSLPVTDADMATVTSGKSALLVAGCFAYRTMNRPHKDGFCFYYVTDYSDLSKLNLCPGGAYQE